MKTTVSQTSKPRPAARARARRASSSILRQSVYARHAPIKSSACGADDSATSDCDSDEIRAFSREDGKLIVTRSAPDLKAYLGDEVSTEESADDEEQELEWPSNRRIGGDSMFVASDSIEDLDDEDGDEEELERLDKSHMLAEAGTEIEYVMAQRRLESVLESDLGVSHSSHFPEGKWKEAESASCSSSVMSHNGSCRSEGEANGLAWPVPGDYIQTTDSSADVDALLSIISSRNELARTSSNPPKFQWAATDELHELNPSTFQAAALQMPRFSRTPSPPTALANSEEISPATTTSNGASVFVATLLELP